MAAKDWLKLIAVSGAVVSMLWGLYHVFAPLKDKKSGLGGDSMRAGAFPSLGGRDILELGDSKTDPRFNSWPVTLAKNLNTATNPGTVWAQDNVGVSTTTAVYWASNIRAVLAGQPRNHAIALYDIGVNDFGSPTCSGQWTTDVKKTVDAIHAKWPASITYITKPWKQGHDTDADTYAACVDAIVESRPSYTAVGDDERVWFKPNVATYSTDGIHFYTTAGQAAKAAQMQTVLGH